MTLGTANIMFNSCYESNELDMCYENKACPFIELLVFFVLVHNGWVHHIRSCLFQRVLLAVSRATWKGPPPSASWVAASKASLRSQTERVQVSLSVLQMYILTNQLIHLWRLLKEIQTC